MGIHHGVIVADVSAAGLVAALDAAAPRFVDGGPFGDDDELAAGGDPNWELALGELDGRAYAVDALYPSADIELVVAASAATGGLVIGCGAETISDAVYLIAARAGQLLRDYSRTEDDVRSTGSPMPGEPRRGELHADDLFAVLAAHGFDYQRWAEAAPKRRLVWLDARDDGTA